MEHTTKDLLTPAGSENFKNLIKVESDAFDAVIMAMGERRPDQDEAMKRMRQLQNRALEAHNKYLKLGENEPAPESVL